MEINDDALMRLYKINFICNHLEKECLHLTETVFNDSFISIIWSNSVNPSSTYVTIGATEKRIIKKVMPKNGFANQNM